MSQQNNDGWQTVLTLFKDSIEQGHLNELLNFVLTDEERKQLATRALLTKALLSGNESQRDISKRLKVSIAKITRGSNFIKITPPKFKEFLKEALNDE